MSQRAFDASAGTSLDSSDFNQNYLYLKRLISGLKAENGASLRKEIFGENDSGPALGKAQMKRLFRFLRKVEKHYEECRRPPIPKELEESIRSRDGSEWLPWEIEALQKVDAWRQQLDKRRKTARRMFDTALEKVRRGEALP
jgi:hypothetical protein